MDVRQRVQTCRLIKHMDKHPEYAKELGLENDSVLSGEREIIINSFKENFTDEYHYGWRCGCTCI